MLKKNAKKDSIDFPIANVTAEDLVSEDKKVHELFITKINERRKNMKVLDFIIIRGQQGFEHGKEINPIEIKIKSKKIQNVFDRFEKNKRRFKLNGILFASSIKNNTEKIFLQAAGLTAAKYALINDKYKQIMGVSNLNKIQNWSKIKTESRWVNVTFQEQTDNRSTSHPSFNFTANNIKLLNFTLKLVDTENKTIEFADGENKFPITDFIIEFLA